MKLRYEDLTIRPIPDPANERGMSTHNMKPGIAVIHKPTGLSVCSTYFRSQFENKNAALKELRELLKSESKTTDPT